MRSLKLFLMFCCVLSAWTVIVQADVIAVDNPSFETPDITDEWLTNPPTDWTRSGGTSSVYLGDGSVIVGDCGSLGPDGSQAVELDSSTNLWQNLGVILQPGWTYTMTFSATPTEEWPENTITAALRYAADPSSMGNVFQDESWNVQTADNWTQYSVTGTYSGDSGQYLAVSLGSVSRWHGFDAVSVEGIPEPSSIILALSGMAGLLAYAWRKRK